MIIGHVLIVCRINALILPNFTLQKAQASFPLNSTVSLHWTHSGVTWCDQFLIGILSFTKVFVLHQGGIPQRLDTQRWNSSGSDSAEMTMWTLVWQRYDGSWQCCDGGCQLPLLWQWWAHRCHTNVNIAVAVLSAVDTAVTALSVGHQPLLH